jgi:hypothetical protein
MYSLKKWRGSFVESGILQLEAMTVPTRKIILALVASLFLDGCSTLIESKLGKGKELGTADYLSAVDLEITGVIDPHNAQFSGLARIQDILILLPQEQERIYWIQIAEIDRALEERTRSIKVNNVSMDGSMPSFGSGSGWEAIAIGMDNNQATVFLAHEEACGNHSVFRAAFGIENNGLRIGSVQKMWDLSKASTTNNGSECKSNFAYESLVWLAGHGLLAITERYGQKEMPVMFRGKHRKPDFLSITPHLYRVSDVSEAHNNGTRLLATSFCHYPSDKDHCAWTPPNKSRSRLLCLYLDVTNLTVSIKEEIPLPLSMTDGQNDFNVEGVVVYNSGILVVNDNWPGETKSTLRYISEKKIKEFRDTCLSANPQ